MKKKILIGSIIAVVILTLVSFTSVVGFQSVKSNSAIASPLFGVRTNRAINKEQDAVTSDYIGKGKDVGIFLFHRNDNIVLVQKLIKRINEMNDCEITNLLRLIKKQLPNNNMIKNLDREKLINALNKIKNKPYKLNELQDNLDDYNNQDTPVYYTIGEPWYPGCFLEFISLLIYGMIAIILFIIIILYEITHPTAVFTCSPGSFCMGALCNKQE